METEDFEDNFNAELFIDKSYAIKKIVVDDVELQISALHNAATTDHDLTGQIVWPAAKLLATYLAVHRELLSNLPAVLELGAGAGLPGLVAAKLSGDPSRCILTDNNDRVLELLNENIELNFATSRRKPCCCPLSWSADEAEQFASNHGDFDLILGADVVFWPSAVPLLFDTIHCLLSRKPTGRFLLSYVNRVDYSTNLLFEHARRSNLSWRTCDLSQLNVSEQLRSSAQILSFTLST